MSTTKEDIALHAKNVKSMAGLLRACGLRVAGGNYTYMWYRVAKYDIDVSHWTGMLWSKGHSLKAYETYACKASRKRHLLKLRGHSCEHCTLTQWNNKPIPIELHHMDGNRTNNVEANLQLLCPNCHAQTSNYKGKNIGAR